MHKNLLRHPLIPAVLCLAVLFVRFSEGHLHLCLDGSEPPASYHLFEDGGHTDTAQPDASASHRDVDIAMTGDYYYKSFKQAGELPAILFAMLLAWAIPRARRGFTALRSLVLVLPATRLLQPPLRGPPVQIQR